MFDARAAAAKTASDDDGFPFVGMDGNTYELPAMHTIPTWAARRVQDGDFDALSECDMVSPEVIDAIEALPLGVLEQLGEAWAEVGTAAGKSGSKSSAPAKRGTQSKRTSRSAAKT